MGRRGPNGKAAETVDVFKGFLSGAAFTTSKGYKGTKLDSMWVRHLFDSFETDDVELCDIALESVLSDIGLTVVGGEMRSALRIGDYGFYAESQFAAQAEILSKSERDNMTGGKFLSVSEWAEVDRVLNIVGNFSTAKFDHSCRGDTFLNLSFRKFAFDVSCNLLRRKVIDPLSVNEDGEDAMDVLTKQYNLLGQKLRRLEEDKILASKEVVVSSVTEDTKVRDRKASAELHALARFNELFMATMKARQQQIADDTKILKFNELRGQPTAMDVVWNIKQLDKTVDYVKRCEDLRGFVVDAIAHQQHVTDTYISMAILVHQRHKTMQRRALNAARAMGALASSAVVVTDEMCSDEELDKDDDGASQPAGRSSKIKARQRARKAREKKSVKAAALAKQALHGETNEKPAEENAEDEVEVHDSDERLRGLYQCEGASVSKKALYDRLGMKMDTAEDYSPVLGVLKQTETEVVMYR